VRVVAAGKDPKMTPVSAAMSADPVTLSPDSNADEAEKVMADRQVRRLPVVEDGHLVGILVTAQLESGDLVDVTRMAKPGLVHSKNLCRTGVGWAIFAQDSVDVGLGAFLLRHQEYKGGA